MPKLFEKDKLREQRGYQTILKKLISFIKSDSFMAFTAQTHTSIHYQLYVNRLEKALRDLENNESNLIEFYYICQQINTDILAKIIATVSSEAAEITTRVPVIKEISWLIDQLLILTLDMGKYITGNLESCIPQKLYDMAPTMPVQLYRSLDGWYQHSIQPLLEEAMHIAECIREKHSIDYSGSETISTLAGAIKLSILLLNMQSRIITGSISQGARLSGILLNDVLERLNIHPLVCDLSKLTKDMITKTFMTPIEMEIILLKHIDYIGNNLEEYTTFSPTA